LQKQQKAVEKKEPFGQKHCRKGIFPLSVKKGKLYLALFLKNATFQKLRLSLLQTIYKK
jgi:hypothetical protein